MKFNKIEYLVLLTVAVSTISEPRSFLLCSASALHLQNRCIDVSVLSLQITSLLAPICMLSNKMYASYYEQNF